MYRRYVALGDSISIDLYPALDAAGVDGWPDDEQLMQLRPGLGAASLLFRNDDACWPEFKGRDLATIAPGIHFRNHQHLSGPARETTDNLATDGATTFGVLAEQIGRVQPSTDETVVTLTVGGNDMLLMLDEEVPPTDLVDGMIANLREILKQIADRLPNSLCIVGTVYDPSDRTGILDGRRYDHGLAWLDEYNEALARVVKGAASGNARFVTVDLREHFAGHGSRAEGDDFWYWRGLTFEPGARGASEVRRVWLDALSRAAF